MKTNYLNPELSDEQINSIALSFFNSGIIEYIKNHKEEFKEFIED